MFQKVNPKQSFPELEEEILKFWKENNTFEKSVETRPEENPYRFYDGPPFITGTPHYGSLLSSICKDIIPRYQTMLGKRCERVWGWDCHGIPIEDKVQKKLGLESNKDIEKVGMKTFTDECYNYTRDTSAEWEWYIDHIGRWVDFKNSYKTMDQDYMESVINVFKKLYYKGLVYKGQRCSLYSWKLSTPISNFEIAMDDSYEEVSDPAITVMFRLKDTGLSKSPVSEGDYILAWTTTPWTIPAHMAIAVNKELAYSRVLSDGKYYILATARVETVFKGKEYEIVESFMGDKLVGLKYTPPFDYYIDKVDPERNHIVYHADFVTDSDGVGIAHEAPEFGDVDFELAKEKGIHISSALDNEGKYTSEISDLVGTHYREANTIISERLKELGLLFKKESINHRVAMCPRTGTPLIYKVQESWFINIKKLKERLIEENEGINWSPEHLKHGQFLKSMESAPDWCISRTRYWGAPMPIWRGENGDIKVLGSREEIFEENKEFGQITKVILVRHGRTDFNDKKRQDSIGRAKLNEKGLKQAEELKEMFKNEKIDVIYSSPLERCINTIKPLSDYKKIEILKDEGLKEVYIKELEGRKIDWGYFRENINEKIGGGETYGEMRERMLDSYKKIISENKGKTIVICSHGDPSYNILSYISNFKVEKDLNKSYLHNKTENINDLFSVKYVFSDSGKELDFHRPYIDEILIKNENNFKAKNVLGIHGFKRDPEKIIDFFEQTKYNFEKDGIKLDAPIFEEGPNINYKNWAKVLDNLDLNKYDTWICHSLGCKVAREYIIENNIKLKRLVLVSASNNKGSTPETKEFSKVLKHEYNNLKNFVEEIIFIKSTDDPDSPYKEVKELANNIGANLISTEGYGHFNLKECKLLEAIIKYGTPMQRIPEVLDCRVESGSMPYAQMHYPFENKQAMEDSFPADFIVEYIGQVRAWFYVMHVLGVALFDTRAFTNVITTGIVMGSDGRKMSKSYKNYPDPKKTIQTYGADAIRFYMADSPLLSGGNMNFLEEGVKEVVKKVILPLWNTYSFFTTYANIDKFEQEKGDIYFVRHGQTDRNLKGIMSGGDYDIELNDTGINQAINAGKKANLEGIKFDIIISSPLNRARKTAELIAKETGYNGNIIIDERLKEQLAGELKDYSHEQIRKEFGVKESHEIRKIFKLKKYNKVECVKDFSNRIVETYEEIKNKYKGKNILIVAHAGVSRPIVMQSLGISQDEALFHLPSMPNATIIKLNNNKLNNNLDKWILSELNKLIGEVKLGLDNYKINEATRPIVEFMDNLTNWYIRRSRKRFWKSENDSDKLQAYETLYTVLIELCKVLAPFMPFVSEHIFKNLTGKESVHLGTFPEKIEPFVLQNLNNDMKLTQRIVSLGLSARANAKIRVRQPLRFIEITEELSDYYLEIIKEELNIKEVKRFDIMPEKICKPNGRLIGPKFGKDVKFIISEAKLGNFIELEEGKVGIPKENPKFILESGEFDLNYNLGEESQEKDSKNSKYLESGFGTVISLETTLDDDLIQEGIARDIVRFIQESRKEANFEVDDRIQISLIDKDGKIKNVISKFGKYIETETLSNINKEIKTPEYKKEVEVEGIKIEISLKR